MRSVWTWGGKSLGYFDREDLWTNEGKHVGKMFDGDIYSPTGVYLGEIMDGERLIFCQRKRELRGAPFKPYSDQAAIKACSDFKGYAMYTGYEEFPEI
ncbi:hypothetical protein L4C54_08540 [Vibrio lamellibrachiae]|uniref:4-fold beta flower protein n=1 Tax=Vibrio lamellibrachiae TaxID=2910253 RepID=UPI003D0FAF7F